MFVLSFALLLLVSFARKPDLVARNHQLKKTNKALLKALKSLTLETESQVGGSKKDETRVGGASRGSRNDFGYGCAGDDDCNPKAVCVDRVCVLVQDFYYEPDGVFDGLSDEAEKAVGDCLSKPPAPRCEGDTLVTFVEPGTADSRGCMVYGREEDVCAMGHCNAAGGKCDEITAVAAPIPCSSMIGQDWACLGCWENEGNPCTAKKWGSPTPVPGKCNDKFGCVKPVDETRVGGASRASRNDMGYACEGDDDCHPYAVCIDRVCLHVQDFYYESDGSFHGLSEETAVAATDNCEFECRKAGHGDQCRGWCNHG